jgi:membrane protein
VPAEGAASRRQRGAARVEGARRRALEIAPHTPGYEQALRAFDRDRQSGGGLLAGALAFRLFGAMLPFALLLAVLLGYAATLDRQAPGKAADAAGIGRTLLESVAESSKLSSGTRWLVMASALVALLWSATSAARAIRAVHSLAWEGRITRLRRPVQAALVLIASIVVSAAVMAAAGWARAELGIVGLFVSVATVAAFFVIWLGASRLLPHGDAPLTALVPGAALFALGVCVVHLGTVLFIAGKVERASETYGSLGVAFTILFWLYVVSRVIVASAMLNAALWGARVGTR